jgi:hypothetical protein
MAPFLVILGLLLLGVAIVAWHTRHTWWHVVAPFLPRPPLTRAARAAPEPVAPSFPAEPDAFAHAPVSQPPATLAAVTPSPVAPVAPAASNGSDPFAHAPDLTQLNGLQSGDTRH